jgi:monoamine oxidase
MNNTPRFDVIVIGAGAAGLAAAATLSEAGKNVCILEARDRIGGRIFSRVEPDVPIAIELGAEFIHGRSPTTLRWLRQFNTPLIDASQRRYSIRNGRLEDADTLFEEMKAGLERARRPKHDLPFAQFLDGPAKKLLSARARELARTLVEGFDAADATRVSTLEILDEWSGPSAADAPTFRPQGGYGELIGAIAAGLDPARVHLHLNTIVHEIEWQRGAVLVRTTHFGQPLEFRAPRAIITLPIGVLQLPPQAPHAVRFDPPLTQKRGALSGLAAGPVIKIVLTFREAFWETLNERSGAPRRLQHTAAGRGRFDDAAFFHVPEAAFPTFWTSLPIRAPLLAAWCAGPKAARLAGLDESQLVARALDSLDMLFGQRAGTREQLRVAHVHDWQADPFACGAYSFVTAGANAARQALARPIQDTLFFAGEAADTGGEAATVAGALQTGERVARRICLSPPLSRRRQKPRTRATTKDA